MEDQHIVHTHVDNGPKVSLSIEKNSRGTNYSVGVSNCSTVDQALFLLNEARLKVEDSINTGETVYSIKE